MIGLRNILAAAACALAFGGGAAAQTPTSPAMPHSLPMTVRYEPLGELPTDVRDAIRASRTTSEILQISGIERLSGQILRVDELVFQPNSVLELQSLDKPWVAIVVRRLKFADPTAPSAIRRRPDIVAPTGAAGARGSNGRDAKGRQGANGRNGQAGQRAAPGGDGGTAALPTVYLIAESVEAGRGTFASGVFAFSIEMPGIEGGAGGQGGSGGRGGRGSNGRDGNSDAVSCRRSAGDGGDGGASGASGPGGNGGRGGDGAPIVLVSSAAGLDVLSYARLVTDGAPGGKGGLGGSATKGGEAGSRGGGRGLCSSGSPGAAGAKGAVGRPGEDGAAGSRGRVFTFALSTRNELFVAKEN
jgi:hypothetical protein